ncbi:MAG: DUF4399 domain-containing protein [Pseudomonadota bacterium]
MKPVVLATLVAFATALPALAQDTPAPDDAEVYFINIEDGDTVTSPILVKFGLRGMGVAPAGTEQENTGHHHLLVNRPAFGSEDASELEFGIPADDQHIHFGGGQTETTVELAPGEHTLQMVLGDLNHIVHDAPVMSDVITITVK